MTTRAELEVIIAEALLEAGSPDQLADHVRRNPGAAMDRLAGPEVAAAARSVSPRVNRRVVSGILADLRRYTEPRILVARIARRLGAYVDGHVEEVPVGHPCWLMMESLNKIIDAKETAWEAYDKCVSDTDDEGDPPAEGGGGFDIGEVRGSDPASGSGADLSKPGHCDGLLEIFNKLSDAERQARAAYEACIEESRT